MVLRRGRLCFAGAPGVLGLGDAQRLPVTARDVQLPGATKSTENRSYSAAWNVRDGTLIREPSLIQQLTRRPSEFGQIDKRLHYSQRP
jgi:hypothetical protein